MGTRSASPCAACRFIRRKCLPECVFAPYFPADEPRRFEIVHKVYGAGNVSKILSELSHDQRDEAVKSLIYEAEARLKDPVHGSVGLVAILQQMLKKSKVDLFDALTELSTLESGAQPNAIANVPAPASSSLSEFQYVAGGIPTQTSSQQFPPLMMGARQSSTHQFFTQSSQPLMIDPHQSSTEQFLMQTSRLHPHHWSTEPSFMQSLQPLMVDLEQISIQSPHMVDPQQSSTQQFLMQQPLMVDPQQSSTKQFLMQSTPQPLMVDLHQSSTQQCFLQSSQPLMVGRHQPLDHQYSLEAKGRARVDKPQAQEMSEMNNSSAGSVAPSRFDPNYQIQPQHAPEEQMSNVRFQLQRQHHR